MRSRLVGLVVPILVACGAKPTPPSRPQRPAPTVEVPPVLIPPQPDPPLAEDTPERTTLGATFIAPVGWTIDVAGLATVLESPEKDSTIALVDVQAASAAAAIAAAWIAYPPKQKRAVVVATTEADRDGWTDQHTVVYETSPNERRTVLARALHHASTWTVILFDVSEPTQGKRGAQLELILGHLFPRGYVRETFAGKTAHELDAARIAALGEFVERAQKALGVPGVSIGLVQDGKVVFAGGFGVKELGKPARADGDTLYMIASNTKAMTTLLLAKLVDDGKLGWDTPVISVMPTFKLGDADTTSRVLVKHLVCACTGLPRQDYEWLMQWKGVAAADELALLGTLQPTTQFGALFQYSNLLAAAGGFLAAHVIDPERELGAVYDEAMQKRVFDPLGMSATTFDFKRALRGNHASAHAPNLDDQVAPALFAADYAIVPLRPAGGAWSSARDVLRFVQLELAKGRLPNGKRYIGEAALLARRAPQVAIGKDVTYGMGLEVDMTWGIPVVHHGGSMIGYKSDMILLPDHGVGAVILTNSDAGRAMLEPFRRKLLEVLFDGNPQADADVASAAKARHDELRAERPRYVLPVPADDAGKLASHYASAALGELAIIRDKGAIVVDIGEWKSELAARHNADQTLSFMTIAPGMTGLELVVGSDPGKRTLVLRDAQHEYVFSEVP